MYTVSDEMAQQLCFCLQLTALLDRQQIQKQERGGWDWKTLFKPLHVNNLLIGGLTCQHIQSLPTVFFVPIIAQYNRVRKHVSGDQNRGGGGKGVRNYLYVECKNKEVK